MLRNIVPLPDDLAVLFLNEVLSLNAQEFVGEELLTDANFGGPQ